VLLRAAEWAQVRWHVDHTRAVRRAGSILNGPPHLVGRGLLSEEDAHLAELDHIAVTQKLLLDALSVDHAACRRAAIQERVAAVLHPDRRVLRRKGGIAENRYVGPLVAAHHREHLRDYVV